MKLYLVGGSVRDKYLGKPPSNDVDIAVEASSFEDMIYGLNQLDFHMWQSRPEFVSVRGKIPHRALATFKDYIPVPPPHDETRAVLNVDFTLCRLETMYSDKRHPDTVTPTNIHHDLMRRDFSMNAIAISDTGQVIDPYNGIADIGNRTIRTVGSANERFTEDPLRVLRALRFAVTLKTPGRFMSISSLTHMALRNSRIVKGLDSLPKERIREELHKMFAHDAFDAFHTLNEYPSIAQACFTKGIWLKPTTEEK